MRHDLWPDKPPPRRGLPPSPLPDETPLLLAVAVILAALLSLTGLAVLLLF